MKISSIEQFNALPSKQKEMKLLVERSRQSFNNKNIGKYKIPSDKSEVGQYLEQHVKRENLIMDVIEKVSRKTKWQKLI